MADNLDDVFQEGAMADEPEPQPVASPEAEPVAVEPQGEPQPEPQAGPDASKPEPGYVPLAAMMDERDKRKAAEQRARDLGQRQAQPQTVPDALDSPDEFAAWQRGQMGQLKLEMSYELASEKHGADKVEAARLWAMEKANSDPAFDAQVSVALQRERNPMNWIVQQHTREALLSDIGDNPDDYFAREAAKRGYVMPSATAPAAVADAVPKQAAPAPAKAPRSLASQGSSPTDIRHVATGPLAGVDAVFA